MFLVQRHEVWGGGLVFRVESAWALGFFQGLGAPAPGLFL